MIKNFVRNKIIGKNYKLTKYFYNKQLNKSIVGKKRFVFVYTMGKVGSTSIYDSLVNISDELYCLHFHKLSQTYLSNREEEMKKNVFNNPSFSKHLYTSLLWKPQWVRTQFVDTNDDRISYISVVREPVSRTISLFFQWIDFTELEHTYRFKSRKPEIPLDLEIPKDDLSKLYEHFFNNFDHNNHNDWIENELNKALGFNIYDVDFDFEKQHSLIRHNNRSLLILKLEVMKDSYTDSIKEFLDLDVELKNSNEARNKPVSKVYQKFIKEIRFSDDYLDKMYGSEYVKHFYSDQEVKALRDKWKK